MRHNRRTLLLILATILGIQCHGVSGPPQSQVAASSTIRAKVTLTAGRSDLAELAQSDPRALLRYCSARYGESDVRDYSCRFVKQERVGGKVTRPQEISVRFRREPYSVDMNWIRNATQAQRALYVEKAWFDASGRPEAWFKPAGAIIKLLVPRIKQPIHGARAKKAARRSIDQFGFERTLELIIKYTDKAYEAGVLDLKYSGEGETGGRATFVFERRLPYNGSEEPFPDALLRFHIDQEWLVPTACFSYADVEGRALLGSYVMTDVEFNLGLTDDDFHPDKIGF